ncbi:MAG TPA: leucyl aminopeptidase [Intrasporangium sp.]|uniref:leucyl aminopeptidase n=1 Tax=Intrasporangium sp. TaxID=1925024 RepID=UPI002D78A043|nr:leucyl aminopeptidase [Intrasporangium sp.]HET7397475.1 leucyl aminopeptidase [Intrasporangium sp.]
MTELTISARPAAEAKSDALILAVVATDDTGKDAGKEAGRDGRPDGAALAPGHGLPRKTARHLEEVVADLGLTGKAGEVTTVAAVPGVAAKVVVLAGIGELGSATRSLEDVRRGFGAAARGLAKKRSAVAVVPGTTTELVAAVAEGLALGAYAPAKVTSAPGGASVARRTDGGDALASVHLVAPADRAARDAVERAATLGGAVAYARDLVNLPPNLLYPASFVDSVGAAVTDLRRGRGGGTVSLETLDLGQLREGGFGGIVGVGQGSVNEPRLAVLSYAPSRPKATLAFVGKGITFDSGGLNLKPAASMGTMKSDMAGAAAVAAAVLAVAELGLPVAVTGYLGLAENLPSGSAQRPSDVVTMRGGKTVEILDTDAEGRMVLADCIALASESRPDAIVDVATLTGAQVVALADTAAVMGNDDAFRGRVVATADAVGEAMWPMPLPRELRPVLDSPSADLAHKGGREGGMLTAGIFLGEFVGDGIPWSHIDIAGPSFNGSGPSGYQPKGGTGFGVRTLVALAESYA